MENHQPRCPIHPIHGIRELDALDPKARENPWAYSDWLRDAPERRVYPLPHESAFYLLHRYEDVKTGFSDAGLFSNQIIPTVKSPFFALMDGEQHRRIRAVVSGLFSQKNIQQWEPMMRKMAEQTTTALLRQKNCELFQTWAIPIPLGILAHIFGLDQTPAALQKLHDQAIAINRALLVTGGTGPRRKNEPNAREKLAISLAIVKNLPRLFRLRRLTGAAGMAELSSMVRFARKDLETPRPNFEHIPAGFSALLDLLVTFLEKLKDSETQQETPGGHVLHQLNRQIQNGDISRVEMMMAVVFILFAGYEPTSSLLSNCFVHLARHPETFRELQQHPEKVDDFIEEALRYYTPVGRFLRRTHQNTEMDGAQIPGKAVMLLLVAAANTDPQKFENGCLFDLNRKNARQHLSFGKGPHFCIGAPLARLNVSIALTELLNRTKSIRVDESAPLQMVTDRDNGIFRYETLPVTVE